MTATTPAVEVEVRYDQTDQRELAAQTADLATRTKLAAVEIRDQATLNQANELVRAAEDWIKAVDRIMDPVREATHRAWKAALKAQDDFKKPVAGPLRILREAVALFIYQQTQAAIEAQRIADEAQRKKNAAEARAFTKDLKAAGATPEQIAETKLQIMATPAPIIASQVEAPSGVALRTLYSAKVVNLEIFLRYLLTDEYLFRIFKNTDGVTKAIEAELKPEAVRFKEKYNVPGTELVKTPNAAWRG
jgi:hypothetical protein